jgi:hypothetical protein
MRRARVVVDNLRVRGGMRCRKTSPLFEIALLLVRFNHIASGIIHADHRIVSPAAKRCVAYCIADCIRFAVPQATERQRVAD